MKKRPPDPIDPHRLRKRAEGKVEHAGSADGRTPERDQLLQELEIHKVELEMQNDQLRTTQVELAEGLDRYTQLFDFAPIGYVTMTREGSVLQVNHVGASLLRRERKHIVGRPFVSFVTQ